MLPAAPGRAAGGLAALSVGFLEQLLGVSVTVGLQAVRASRLLPFWQHELQTLATHPKPGSDAEERLHCLSSASGHGH